MEFNRHQIEWTAEKIARIWAYYAENSSPRTRFFGFHVGDHVAAVINRTVDLKSQPRILDLSCGHGDLIAACLPYLRQGQRISGTDFCADNVEQVNDRFRHTPVFGQARWVQQFPSEAAPESYDLVIATEVIEHLNDQELPTMLDEAKRLLVPGGTVVLTTPNDEDLAAATVMCPDCGCVFHRWQHLRKWTAESLEATMQRHGFRTKVLKAVAWGSPRFKRWLLELAAIMRQVPRHGLVYVGEKPRS